MRYQVIKVKHGGREEPDNYLPMHQISDIVRDELEEFKGIKYLLTYIHSEYCFLEIWVIDAQVESVLSILQEKGDDLIINVGEVVNVEYSET